MVVQERDASRVIAFVDLDYFFAQVEEMMNPGLKEKPVAVCVYSGRTPTSGVVSTCNYLARGYGVKAGIPISRAMKLLPPTAVFLPVRMDLYSEVSGKTMSILKEYSRRLRVESIDEASMDITDEVGGDYEKAEALAFEVKRRLASELGLQCTIGVGPNRIVAKMAADLSKPNGLRVVRPDEVESFLSGLDVERLPGVGRKLASLLAEKGVKTLGDLAKLDIDNLTRIVGRRRAAYLVKAAGGKLDEVISERGPRKQLSRIITLRRDTRDVDEIMEQLSPVLDELIGKMRGLGITARTIGLYVVTATLQPITRQRAIHEPGSKEVISETIREMLSELLKEKPGIRIRRAGARFSGLTISKGQKTLSSFIEDNP